MPYGPQFASYKNCNMYEVLLKMDLELSGKVVVVEVASRGLSFAVADKR